MQNTNMENMKSYPKTELVFSTLSIVCLTSAPFLSETLPFLTPSIIQVVVFAVSMLFLFSDRDFEGFFQTLTVNRVITFFTIWIMLSTFWSVWLSFTLIRGIQFTLVTFFAIYLGTRFTMSELRNIIFSAFAIIGVLSLLVVIFYSEYGVMTQIEHLGRWRGILNHKNRLGRLMGLAIVLYLFAWPGNSSRTLSYLRWGAIALFAVLLYQADSVGALLGLVSVSFAYLSIWSLRIDFRLRLAAIILQVLLGLILVGLFFQYLDVLLDTFDRNQTFVSRLDLWRVALESLSDRFFIGYGFDAAFSPESPIYYLISWRAPHAHNGFIDVLVQVGFIGLVLLTLFIVRSVVLGITLYIRTKDELWFVLLIIFLSFIVANLGENSINGGDIIWLGVVATATRARIVAVEMQQEAKTNLRHERIELYKQLHEGSLSMEKSPAIK